MTSPRERRLYTQYHQVDTKKEKKILKWVDGQVCPGVTIDGSEITFDTAKVYPDDMLAVVRDMIYLLNLTNPDEHNENALTHLKTAIYEMDKRAVKRHGYSYSEAERNLTLPY